MYWYAYASGLIVDSNNKFITKLTNKAASKIADDHNKAIRQLAQREITKTDLDPEIAINKLIECCHIKDCELGNEIHLQRGDDGYWYATTTVDTLNQ